MAHGSHRSSSVSKLIVSHREPTKNVTDLLQFSLYEDRYLDDFAATYNRSFSCDSVHRVCSFLCCSTVSISAGDEVAFVQMICQGIAHRHLVRESKAQQMALKHQLCTNICGIRYPNYDIY